MSYYGKYLEHCLAHSSHLINVSSYSRVGGGVTSFCHSESWGFSIPVRMAITKKSTNPSAGDVVEERELLCRGKLVQPLWEALWIFFRKLKIEWPYDPANPFWNIYPKKSKSVVQKDTSTPMFLAALLKRAKKWKQPRCPRIDEWKKMWCVYIMEY